jgi:hypothetical protein
MDGAEPDGTREDFPNVYDGARGVHFIEKTMESGRSTEKWTRALRGDPREGSVKQPKPPPARFVPPRAYVGCYPARTCGSRSTEHSATRTPGQPWGQTGQDRRVSPKTPSSWGCDSAPRWARSQRSSWRWSSDRPAAGTPLRYGSNTEFSEVQRYQQGTRKLN